MTQEIPIFFTFDRHYVIAAAVTFHSLLRHADPHYGYALHVLHSTLTAADCRLLRRVVSRFGHATLTFTDTRAAGLVPEGLEGKKHFSKEIYYKLLAAELFPQYGRILCSDVDVVFRGDIAPSYFMHPGTDFYYAGVGQIIESSRMDTYGTDFSPAELEVLRQEIAAGYMLMNLDAIRRDGLQPTLTAHYLKNFHRLRLPEQDCLILCCWPKVRHLPLEYVVCNSYYRLRRPLAFDRTNPSLPPTQAEREALLAQALDHPVQLHYVGPDKPWNSLCCPCQGIWLSELWQARCVCAYLWRLPRLVGQKLRRYSLRRFVGKLGKRFSSGGDSG